MFPVSKQEKMLQQIITVLLSSYGALHYNTMYIYIYIYSSNVQRMLSTFKTHCPIKEVTINSSLVKSCCDCIFVVLQISYRMPKMSEDYYICDELF